MTVTPSETNQNASRTTPTQVAYPKRATWRMFFQTLLASLPTANGILLAIQALISQPPYDGALPGWVYIAVNGAVLLGALLSKIAAQIMANPLVSQWINTHWPKFAIRPARDSTKDVERA